MEAQSQEQVKAAKSQSVSEFSRVLLSYVLEDEESVLEGCDLDAPQWFELGQKKLHPVIEAQLVGRKQGESWETVLDPAIFFGPYNSALKFQVSQKKLPEKIKLLEIEEGFESLGPDRKRHHFRVVEKNSQNMTFDGNPYDQGSVLRFKATLLEIA